MSTRVTVGDLESGQVAVHYKHGTLVLTDERPGRSVLCVQVGTGKVLELRASERVVFDLRHGYAVDAGHPSAPVDGPTLLVPRALLEALARGEQA